MGGTPDPPAIAERQAAKLPDGGDLSVRNGDAKRRRMAYASTILTGPGGVLGSPATTASTMGASTLGG